MPKKEHEIYRYDDNISFRECTLSNNYSEFETGNCTNYELIDVISDRFLHCKQQGIHFHCTKHPNIELDNLKSLNGTYFKCPKCKKEFKVDDLPQLIQGCRKMLNIKEFENAKLIRLDDWYTFEKSKKIDIGDSEYWITSDIKKDKDGDTLVVLYIGKKNTTEKCQFFIKPEKLQLTSDHKDLDPATILSKIEVTLKDRKITQEYDEKEN